MGIPVQLFTDFVCPFCFIAERSSVLRLQREYDIDIEWIGYELHPDTPPGGVPLSSYLPDAEAMLGYVKTFAARFGKFRQVGADLRLPFFIHHLLVYWYLMYGKGVYIFKEMQEAEG